MFGQDAQIRGTKGPERLHVCMASLFPRLSFYLLSFPSFNLSITSPKLSFLLALVPPVHLNLFVWIHTRHSMQLISWDVRPHGNWCLSPEDSGCSICKLPPVKTFLGQVPAECGSLTRDHTQPTKAYSHLFIIVSVFQKKTLLLLVLSLYDDSPGFLACTFPVSVRLASPTVSAVSLDDVWYMTVLHPTHSPGINAATLWLLP